MGISRKFIKFVKYSYAFCLIAIWGCFIVPFSLKAQDNSNNSIVTINGKKYYKHTVEKSETIYGIAEKFNLTPKDIILENPSAIDGVKTGDILIIPIISGTKPGDTSKTVALISQKEASYFYHDVLEKETLYSLSKKYNTTVSAIDSLNPEITVKGLKKGQKIRIPLVVPTSTLNPTVKKDTAKQLLQKPNTVNKPPHKDSTITIQQNPKTDINKNTNEANAYKNLVTQQTRTDVPVPAAPIQDTGKKKYRYNIVLIMPFASENSDSLRLNRLLDETEQIPLATRISVDYYHGLIMALDSLAKTGLKANLHVFNVLPGSDSSSYVLDSILKNPYLAEANLIIGPPSSSGFKKVARFADMHHIPIVSPISTESSVLKNNPWTSKANPSAVTETEATADFIAKNYPHANIIVIHNKSANDEYYEIFKKRFKKDDSVLGYKDTLRHAESRGGVSGLKTMVERRLLNVVVMPYQGAPYIAAFVNELANSSIAADDSVILFGMHNWANNDALAADNLDTLNFHFPSNEFVNYHDSLTRKFITKYRNNYLSEPSEYSYQGFDLGMFYVNLLNHYGSDVQNHLGDTKYKGIHTSFDMFRSNPANGYENIAVYILEYSNYTEKLDSK